MLGPRQSFSQQSPRPLSQTPTRNFWRDVGLAQLQPHPAPLPPKLKEELRKGVPQMYRRHVWLQLSGATSTCGGDFDGYYCAAVALLFARPELVEGVRGWEMVRVEGKSPLFGSPKLGCHEWATPANKEGVKRLLHVLQNSESRLQYCPALPSLLCALLQVLTEPETYALVLSLITRSAQAASTDRSSQLDRLSSAGLEPKMPHFLLGQMQEELFELSFYELARRLCPVASGALDTLYPLDQAGRMHTGPPKSTPFQLPPLPSPLAPPAMVPSRGSVGARASVGSQEGSVSSVPEFGCAVPPPPIPGDPAFESFIRNAAMAAVSRRFQMSYAPSKMSIYP